MNRDKAPLIWPLIRTWLFQIATFELPASLFICFFIRVFIFGLRLPEIDRRVKWLVFASGYIGFCVLYMFTGRVYLGEPTRLVRSAIDQRIPFLSWMVWIYHTQFLFLIFTVWSLKQTAIISRTFYR